MSVSVGDTLPEARLSWMGEEGPEYVSIAELTAGRKVVVFGLPGAFTGTCSRAHVPSFTRHAAAIKARGIAEIICVSVNDPFVMSAWARHMQAEETLRFLADHTGRFTRALGLAFDMEDLGFYGRSQRYALMAEDGVVRRLHLEAKAGDFERSSGAAMLAVL